MKATFEQKGRFASTLEGLSREAPRLASTYSAADLFAGARRRPHLLLLRQEEAASA